MSEEKENLQNEETATTLVKVRSTLIKFYNSETDKAEDLKALGKFTLAQAKKYVKEINSKNVLINKENVDEEFYVNTVTLYQLKEGDK